MGSSGNRVRCVLMFSSSPLSMEVALSMTDIIDSTRSVAVEFAFGMSCVTGGVLGVPVLCPIWLVMVRSMTMIIIKTG